MKSDQRHWGTLEHAWATTFILGYSTLGCAIKCKCGVNQRDSGPLGYACVTVFFFLGIFLECCQFFTFGAKAFRVSFLAILLKKLKEKKKFDADFRGKIVAKKSKSAPFFFGPYMWDHIAKQLFLLWKDWNEEGMPHHQPPSLTPAVAGLVWLDQKQHNAWRTRRLHVGPALSWPFNGRIRLFLHFMLSPK